jgi:glycosyltransferase involved in cell wall biosynthesis
MDKRIVRFMPRKTIKLKTLNINSNQKGIIVVSAVNFFEGGPLSVLKDCLNFLSQNYSDNYKIVALVHDIKLVEIPKISFIEFKKARKSYFHRLYYEYYQFKILSKKLKPQLWLSLHDITPNIEAKIRSVYCHNPAAFYKSSFRDLFFQPTIYFFSLLYKWLYRINIKKNNFVIVQQSWMKGKFIKHFKIQAEKIVIAVPDSKEMPILHEEKNDVYTFFYPAFPRVFKNFEIICKAVSILEKKIKIPFNVLLTINGTENKYAKSIIKKYRKIKNLQFIGLLSREQVFSYYSTANCLLFPSKLETWGLPLSEFKTTKKPILAADLDYAHETIGNYEKVSFFNPENANFLAILMENILKNNIEFQGNIQSKLSHPLAVNWEELFEILLSKEKFQVY